jgi:hypothetical protein
MCCSFLELNFFFQFLWATREVMCHYGTLLFLWVGNVAVTAIFRVNCCNVVSFTQMNNILVLCNK